MSDEYEVKKEIDKHLIDQVIMIPTEFLKTIIDNPVSLDSYLKYKIKEKENYNKEFYK